MSAGVWGLVVTRDRPRLLAECLRGLLAQSRPLAGIVVLDNASSPPAADRLRAEGLLDDRRVRLVRSEVNLGGAGGFAEVLKVGQDGDADWLWLMDDDAEPRRDALARLLAAPAAQSAGTAALCTSVVDARGAIDPLHRCRLRRLVIPLPLSAYRPGRCEPVDCASFVGLLVRGGAARAAGLPRREYFIGYDDAEYSLRVRRHGEIRLVPESVIVHKTAVGAGTATRRSRLWNRLLGAHYTSSPWESYWRDLYRVRNLVALRSAHDGLSGGGLAGLIAVYVVKTLMYEPRPLRRIPWLIRFALKGRRGDFTAPSPEQWRASVSARC